MAPLRKPKRKPWRNLRREFSKKHQKPQRSSNKRDCCRDLLRNPIEILPRSLSDGIMVDMSAGMPPEIAAVILFGISRWIPLGIPPEILAGKPSCGPARISPRLLRFPKQMISACYCSQESSRNASRTSSRNCLKNPSRTSWRTPNMNAWRNLSSTPAAPISTGILQGSGKAFPYFTGREIIEGSLYKF